MSRLPRSFEDLLALLKTRHAQIMEGRPDKGPGSFKADPNRAGATVFVCAGTGSRNARQGIRNL
jgi:hypothetical protein